MTPIPKGVIPESLAGQNDPAAAASSLVTFAPAHSEMAYFLRIQDSDGGIAECYTPCTLALPPGRTRISVIAPQSFQREIELSGRPALVKLTHLSKWRYGVGGLLLGISLAEFIYGAFYFPWNGGGDPRDASIAAAAWAFGAIELTSAITLLSLGGKNGLQIVDDPTRLKAQNPGRSSLRLAALGAVTLPSFSGVSARFRF